MISEIHSYLLESILPVEHSRFTVRIWKQESMKDGMPYIDAIENDVLVRSAKELAGESTDKLALGWMITSLKNVNAVEVKDAAFIGDSSGLGIVLYKDWP